MLITVTCNECQHEFELSREDPNVLLGRTYCEEHSVLKRQRVRLTENCYYCDEPLEQGTPATVHFGLATFCAHLDCCTREVAKNDGTLRVSNSLTGDFSIPRLIYS